jgi:membrane associated rhomboid family serine protease
MFFKFATGVVLLACILLHPIRVWAPWDIVRLSCLQPSLIQSLQVHRLFTHAFIHWDFYHIFFNLVSFAPLALTLEKQIGSLQLLHLLSIFSVLNGLSILIASIFLSIIYPANYTSCTIGLSGVVFALLTKEVLDRKKSSMFAIVLY